MLIYIFCEAYRIIAQKRGNILSQIKGVEREKIEAEQTQFWSFIYVDGDKKQLWLVPKEKRQDAKKFIDDSNKQSQENGNKYLCCFESLTMRALYKLCFAEESTFVKGMPGNLRELQKVAKEFPTTNNKGNVDENKVKEKNKKILNFFKRLLKSEYAKEKLLIFEKF